MKNHRDLLRNGDFSVTTAVSIVVFVWSGDLDDLGNYPKTPGNWTAPWFCLEMIWYSPKWIQIAFIIGTITRLDNLVIFLGTLFSDC